MGGDVWGMEPLRLAVPSRPEYPSTLRDVTVDAARLAGLDEDATGYAARVACGLAAPLLDPDFASPGAGALDFACRPTTVACS
jgi:hypothetical protein